MHYSKEEIERLGRVDRLKIINSITGIKPANLIGTIDKDGVANLAIFSSVVHLGSNPALIGFILRPKGDVPRNTYDNIIENGVYTINHIHLPFSENAHYTSAKFDKTISEFDRCGLEEEYIEGFKAPFVLESNFKFGLKFIEEIKIPINETSMIIGEVEQLILPDNAIDKDQDINLENTGGLGISGLNSYYKLQKVGHYPYARVGEFPLFKGVDEL